MGIDREVVSKKLDEIKKSFDSPEEINHDMPPSKRIIKIDQFSGYNKISDGVLIAKEIGLDKIRQECKHFNDWITKLEVLS